MKLTAKHVEHLIDSTMQHTMKTGLHRHVNDPTRVNYLRVSSLPFCARQFFLNVTTSLQTSRQNPTSMMYFVNVGTATHEVLQESLAFSVSKAIADYDVPALPHKAVLVQNWKCKMCGHVHKFVPRPSECTWCHAPESKLQGKETQVRWGKKVLGHMDGTFAFPNPLKLLEPYSKAWLHIPIDYKTTTLSAINGKGLPYADNVTQLSTYGMIKKEEGYNVPFTALIYVSRDNPHKRKVCVQPVNYDAVRSQLSADEKLYLKTWDVIQSPTIDAAQKLPPVVNKGFADSCGYCQFIKVCEANAAGRPKELVHQLQSRVTWLKSESFKKRSNFPTD